MDRCIMHNHFLQLRKEWIIIIIIMNNNQYYSVEMWCFKTTAFCPGFVSPKVKGEDRQKTTAIHCFEFYTEINYICMIVFWEAQVSRSFTRKNASWTVTSMSWSSPNRVRSSLIPTTSTHGFLYKVPWSHTHLVL